MTQRWSSWYWHLSVAMLAIATSGDCSLAQITPDGTLGNETSVVTPTIIDGVKTRQIDGGATRGANLFHSFDQFSVPTGSAAYFNNAQNIQNIISRVTGESISNIDGLIRANGTANLFLLNPNGIIFGPNARLDVGGSFVGTTANTLRFGDQGVFSATNPEAPPLLTVNPSALLFNQLNPGAITNQGFLTAGTGHSLVLAGGDIGLNRGLMAVRGGRIELAAIAGTGTVGLNPDGSLSIPTDLPRADVSVFGSQLAVTAGNNSSLAIHARNLDISGNSLILSGIGLGAGAVDSQSGSITLDATGIVQIREGSWIENIVAKDESGNGGDIRITAGALFLTDDTRLSASVFGKGNAGNIIIDARDQVSLDNGATIFDDVQETGKGNAGNIRISTGVLQLSNGSQLSAATSGQGNAGDVVIEARNHINIKDGSLIGFIFSGIFSTVEKGAEGQGGDIRISTGSVELYNGARINASTAGVGDAGNIIIDARERIFGTSEVRNTKIPFDGTLVPVTFILNNDISSTVEKGGQGNAGDIQISTGTLEALNDTAVITSTSGVGNGGNVIIKARDHVIFDNSNILSRVNSEGVGQGGDVRISTGSLKLLNSAQIDASTFGRGDAGNVEIVTNESVTVAGIGRKRPFGITSDEREGTSSAIFSTTGDNPAIPGTGPLVVGTGKGGDITITAPLLKVSDGAVIDARTFNNKPGGDINLTLDTLQLRNGGQIFTTSQGSGSAGTIAINANNEVDIAGTDATYFSRLNEFPRRVAPISSNSGLYVRASNTGSAGNINLTTPRLTLNNQGTINAESNTVDGGNINLNVRDLLLLRRNSAISATAGLAQGVGNGGNITVNTPFIVAVPSEDSDIKANAYTGKGGRVLLTAEGIFGTQLRDRLTPESDITASSEFGVNGVIDIKTLDIDPSHGLVVLPAQLVDSSALITSGCGVSRRQQQSKFIVTGRGGLPLRPGDANISPYPTGSVRSIPSSSPSIAPAISVEGFRRERQPNGSDPATNATASEPAPIVEATGWVFNERGEVVLTAQPNPATPHNPWTNPATCHG